MFLLLVVDKKNNLEILLYSLFHRMIYINVVDFLLVLVLTIPYYLNYNVHHHHHYHVYEHYLMLHFHIDSLQQFHVLQIKTKISIRINRKEGERWLSIGSMHTHPDRTIQSLGTTPLPALLFHLDNPIAVRLIIKSLINFLKDLVFTSIVR